MSDTNHGPDICQVIDGLIHSLNPMIIRSLISLIIEYLSHPCYGQEYIHVVSDTEGPISVLNKLSNHRIAVGYSHSVKIYDLHPHPSCQFVKNLNFFDGCDPGIVCQISEDQVIVGSKHHTDYVKYDLTNSLVLVTEQKDNLCDPYNLGNVTSITKIKENIICIAFEKGFMTKSLSAEIRADILGNYQIRKWAIVSVLSINENHLLLCTKNSIAIINEKKELETINISDASRITSSTLLKTVSDASASASASTSTSTSISENSLKTKNVIAITDSQEHCDRLSIWEIDEMKAKRIYGMDMEIPCGNIYKVIVLSDHCIAIGSGSNIFVIDYVNQEIIQTIQNPTENCPFEYIDNKLIIARNTTLFFYSQKK